MSGYLLCASPRSGSTLLCDLLARTGLAGEPASYLRPASIARYKAEWQLPETGVGWGRPYLDAIRRHSAGDSGCPALRIMWSDMPAVLDRMRTIAPQQTSDLARFRHLLGIEHVIHLRRDDLVAQAVSLVIAKQTGRWHINADGSARQVSRGGGPPIYDEDRIADELLMLEAELEGWNAWFDSQSISPVRLTYEALVADPAKAVTSVLHAIGRPSRRPPPDPGTGRLANRVNDEWVARFRRRGRG